MGNALEGTGLARFILHLLSALSSTTTNAIHTHLASLTMFSKPYRCFVIELDAALHGIRASALVDHPMASSSSAAATSHFDPIPSSCTVAHPPVGGYSQFGLRQFPTEPWHILFSKETTFRTVVLRGAPLVFAMPWTWIDWPV